MIKVGAQTEAEQSELKDRVDDAVCATRAAVEEGIVPGGGKALASAWGRLDPTCIDFRDLDSDGRRGVCIVRDAALIPTQQIAQNAGMVGERVTYILDVSRGFIAIGGKSSSVPPDGGDYAQGTGTLPFDFGYNAATDRFEALITSGVIDPAKVVRCALQNAASVASTLLLTESAVATVQEKK